ncbi:hypothetical protein [Streptococcus porcorum]|uniref:Membrane protein YczE n=1 Tax=Streptococcus porcorum TaxID=701526 RepID=A0ABV2JF93_9STRE
MSLKLVWLSLWYYTLSALGVSLTIKAGIGVSSFNSFNVALSESSRITIGVITTGINLLFLLVCLLLDQKRSWRNYFLMVLSLFGFGYVINFFTYTVLSQLAIHSYVFAFLMFILGTSLAGYGVGHVIAYGVLQFPIEKACQLLEARTRFSFSFYRYGVDFLSILGSVAISVYFHFPLFVREGTIVSFFLLSFVIARSQNRVLMRK